MCKQKYNYFQENPYLSMSVKICPYCNDKINTFAESKDAEAVRFAAQYMRACAAKSDILLQARLQALLTDKTPLTKGLSQQEIKTDGIDQSVGLSDPHENEGFGGRFMKCVAWFLWIGGFILATVTSLKNDPNYHGAGNRTIFDWTNFFQTAAVYFFAGAFALCMSELLTNVQTIKNRICSMDDKISKR